MVRCTVPVWTTILQYFITGESISRSQSLSLMLIVIGSVMVCYGDVYLYVIVLLIDMDYIYWTMFPYY